MVYPIWCPLPPWNCLLCNGIAFEVLQPTGWRTEWMDRVNCAIRCASSCSFTMKRICWASQVICSSSSDECWGFCDWSLTVVTHHKLSHRSSLIPWSARLTFASVMPAFWLVGIALVLKRLMGGEIMVITWCYVVITPILWRRRNGYVSTLRFWHIGALVQMCGDLSSTTCPLVQMNYSQTHFEKSGKVPMFTWRGWSHSYAEICG